MKAVVATLAALVLSGCVGHDPEVAEAAKQHLRDLHALSCDELEARARSNDVQIAALPAETTGLQLRLGLSEDQKRYALLRGENDQLNWIAVRHKNCQPASWWILRMADDLRYPASYEHSYPYYY